MLEKIQRAEYHLDTLKIRVSEFVSSGPIEISCKTEGKQFDYFVSKLKPVPKEFALITGDILQNLRSALEHVAWKLTANKDRIEFPKKIYFPIVDNEAALRKKLHTSSLWSDEVNAIICKLKPFKDGSEPLWQLHGLAKIDRHRVLIVTGASFEGFSPVASMMEMLNRFSYQKSEDVALPHFYIKPAKLEYPLTEGQVLYTDAVGHAPDSDLKFKFELVINEKDCLEGGLLIDSLQIMLDAVKGVHSKLKPYFK